jgi:hypothetical protein
VSNNCENPVWPKGRVLFAGQAYYNAWYLSRALRKIGWKADVLNWDPTESGQIYYHGEDFRFIYDSSPDNFKAQLWFYIKSLVNYDIFHFSNTGGINFGPILASFVKNRDFRLAMIKGMGSFYEFFIPFLKNIEYNEYTEINLLKRLGKKIVYSHNGCLDGVSQTSFKSWAGLEPVCDSCRWRDNPMVCSDDLNLAWGKNRNQLADYQCTLGGNRIDYNDNPRVHEVPEFYCLDPNFWKPDMIVLPQYQLNFREGTVKLYHAVGNFKSRTGPNNRNIKSTHIYLPLIERLKGEGYKVEMIFCSDVPNQEVRFYQVQADIFLEMLTFGWFGANAREAMMLGKPVICYLRPEWLDTMRREIPEYVAELPIVRADPQTVYDVLVDLIKHPDKRSEIGRRSRQFAVKWHSMQAGARRFDKIYGELLRGGTT